MLRESHAAGIERNITYWQADLNIRTLFFKPVYGRLKSYRQNIDSGYYVSGLRSELNYIMEVHQLLSTVEEHDTYIIQPLGVMSMPAWDQALYGVIKGKLDHHGLAQPATQAPMILYSDLSLEDYRRCDSSQHHYLHQHADSFIKAINRVMEIFNSARVCHMDLRPENIMYKVDDASEQLLIKVIDMENAVKWGEYLPIEECFQHDQRYPYIKEYFENGVDVVASYVHNTWYQLALSEWVRSDSADFYDFMGSNGSYFKNSLREDLLGAIQSFT